jgi:hypothetical protein
MSGFGILFAAEVLMYRVQGSRLRVPRRFPHTILHGEEINDLEWEALSDSALHHLVPDGPSADFLYKCKEVGAELKRSFIGVKSCNRRKPFL